MLRDLTRNDRMPTKARFKKLVAQIHIIVNGIEVGAGRKCGSVYFSAQHTSTQYLSVKAYKYLEGEYA